MTLTETWQETVTLSEPRHGVIFAYRIVNHLLVMYAAPSLDVTISTHQNVTQDIFDVCAGARIHQSGARQSGE